MSCAYNYNVFIIVEHQYYYVFIFILQNTALFCLQLQVALFIISACSFDEEHYYLLLFDCHIKLLLHIKIVICIFKYLDQSSRCVPIVTNIWKQTNVNNAKSKRKNYLQNKTNDHLYEKKILCCIKLI